MTNAIVTTLPSVAEFIEQLDRHDWTYMYASGHAYNKGRDSWMALKAIAQQDDTMAAVFKAYNEYKDGKRDAKPVETDFIVEQVAEASVVDNTRAAANDERNNDPDPDGLVLPTTRDELLALVSDGKVFAAEFIKRDGSLRTMQCRLGVAKHLKGGAKAFDDAAKGILTVFDMKATGYRSIRIDALQGLTIKGQRYAAA